MADRDLNEAIRGWNQGTPQRFNLAVLGATGVGKSTLVNAVFGETVARTGIGEPVTRGIRFHANRSGTLGLYDFEGVESFAELEGFVRNFVGVYEERLSEDPTTAIHGVWYCIKAGDRRFDEQQAAVVRRLADLELPVLLVMTQTPWREGRGISPDAQALVDHIRGLGLPIVGGAPIPVAALPDDFAGLPIHGLDRLLLATFDAAPMGVRTAIASAQRIDARMKRAEAKKVVGAAIAITSGIAATPIPVPDAPVLVAAQFEMLRRVSALYEVEVSATALAGALAGSSATMAGRSIAGALLKLVPIAGSVINAGTAGALTWVLGWAWLELCERDWNGEVDLNALAKAGRLTPLLSEALRVWAAKRPQR